MSYEPKFHQALVLCCLLVLTGVAEAAEPATSAGLTVEPDSISIGMTYRGATVRLTADAPAGYEAAIRVMGKAEPLTMKRKGKVGGVLWMSVGEVTFEAVPDLYILLTSMPLQGAAPAAVLRERTLGYEALASARGPEAGLYLELIKLKEQEGCFKLAEAALARTDSGRGDSTSRLTGSFRLPARAPAGLYMVDLFGFHEQQAVHLGSTTLRLEHAGLARVLRFVAEEHGVLYGGVAILVAVLAGLLTGFVFRPKRGKGK